MKAHDLARVMWMVLLLPAMAALPATAQEGGSTRLEVTVVDSAGAPVDNATVEVAGVRGRGTTNERGVARISGVPVGNRIVQASRIGFGTTRVAVDFLAGQPSTRTITLVPEAIAVRGVSATAERQNQSLALRGFYTRQRREQGTFIDADRIAEIHPMRTVDLFRRVRGFYVGVDRRGYFYIENSRGAANMSTNCATPLFFLDGVLIPGRTSNREDVLSFITPESLAGIEAYAGPATIPPQYNVTGSACGVILLWSKTGSD